MFRALFSLPRSVWLLGLISLVNDSASELVHPLVPLYLSGALWEGVSAAVAVGFSAACARAAAG